MKARLILICGLPGSGKTTLSLKLAKKLGAVRLCPDDWMRELDIDLFDGDFRNLLEQLMWKHAQELLKLGVSVILESGFWTRAERDEKRLWAHAHHAAVELHYLDVPIDELAQRTRKRHAKDGVSEVAITRPQLEQWLAVFETPDAGELKLFDRPSRA